LPDSLTPVVFTGDNVYQRANDFLKRLARNAPEKGYGYHKTKFEIEFADGTIYEGRYDLKRHDVFWADLGRHVRQFCEFYSGQRRPEHMTKQEYQSCLAQFDPGMVKRFARFLSNYEL
jgi:hypothetical protein